MIIFYLLIRVYTIKYQVLLILFHADYEVVRNLSKRYGTLLHA